MQPTTPEQVPPARQEVPQPVREYLATSNQARLALEGKATNEGMIALNEGEKERLYALRDMEKGELFQDLNPMILEAKYRKWQTFKADKAGLLEERARERRIHVKQQTSPLNEDDLTELDRIATVKEVNKNVWETLPPLTEAELQGV